MKNFILGLLAVILIKPSFAQEMSEAFGSKALAMNQAYSSLNAGFDNISGVLDTKKIEPISQGKAYLLAKQGLIDSQSSWGLEKTGFEEAIYSLPVQIKILPISEEQAQLFLNSIEASQKTLGINQAYFGSMPHVAMFGPGNGGGGTLYKAQVTGFQDYLRGQAQTAIKFMDKLQGVEVNPYNSEITYWKSTANKNQIEQFLSFVYGAGNSTAKETITYAEEIANTQYRNAGYFTQKALPSQFVADNVSSYYGANTANLIKQFMEENQIGSADKFYQIDDHFQNGIISVVGPGNGGGGTYIK
ncbi:MAG: hypothetical protein OXJ52_05315 [Oligoflexia bacterium]|nr:hypothetical protein [Oligoflexia bacterium]